MNPDVLNEVLNKVVIWGISFILGLGSLLVTWVRWRSQRQQRIEEIELQQEQLDTVQSEVHTEAQRIIHELVISQNQRISRLEQERITLKESLANVQREKVRLESDVNDLRQTVIHLTGELERLRVEFESERQRRQSLQQEREEAVTQLFAKDRLLDEKNARIRELESKLASQETTENSPRTYHE